MDKRSRGLMEYLSEALDHPDVSGFEVLEVLDIRSKLAFREPLFSEKDKVLLENLDRRFLGMAHIWLSRISEVANLPDMRQRAHALPSHWWWYLDEIAKKKERMARSV